MISAMNMAKATNNDNDFKNYLCFFTGTTITRFTSHSWIPVPENLEEMRIVILAHSNRPIRALGFVYTDVEKNKTVFKRISFHHETNKISIDRKSRKSLEIYTCRRGFWVVLKDSLDFNLSMNDIDKRETEQRLQSIYKQYVRGMEVTPDATLISGYEQFMIGIYPTPEWLESVNANLSTIDSKLKKKPTRKSGGSKKRKLDEESSSDESSNEVDSEDVKANPAKYVLIESSVPKFPELTYELKIVPDVIECSSAIEGIKPLFPWVESMTHSIINEDSRDIINV
jgi:hypothetical protein